MSQRLIVALDVPSLSEMETVVDSLDEQVSFYKVGHQIFTAEGPRVISQLKSLGKQVFLDLKLHEISNSVAAAVEAAGRHGVDMVTVHASGGLSMIRAAVEAASTFPRMKIIALTVVTGMTDEDLESIGVTGGCERHTNRLCRLALDAGCHGVVSSPREVAALRQTFGASFDVVTPGVRPAGAAADDQARIASPGAAITAGASHIVVGRPIVAASSPRDAAVQILAEMEAAVD